MFIVGARPTNVMFNGCEEAPPLWGNTEAVWKPLKIHIQGGKHYGYGRTTQLNSNEC